MELKPTHDQLTRWLEALCVMFSNSHYSSISSYQCVSLCMSLAPRYSQQIVLVASNMAPRVSTCDGNSREIAI